MEAASSKDMQGAMKLIESINALENPESKRLVSEYLDGLIQFLEKVGKEGVSTTELQNLHSITNKVDNLEEGNFPLLLKNTLIGLKNRVK